MTETPFVWTWEVRCVGGGKWKQPCKNEPTWVRCETFTQESQGTPLTLCDTCFTMGILKGQRKPEYWVRFDMAGKWAVYYGGRVCVRFATEDDAKEYVKRHSREMQQKLTVGKAPKGEKK